MSHYYLDTLKEALTDPAMTKEKLQGILEQSQCFFGILKVKLESKDPELRKTALQEILELKSLLEARL